MPTIDAIAPAALKAHSNTTTRCFMTALLALLA
jgi:hypothetical protein